MECEKVMGVCLQAKTLSEKERMQCNEKEERGSESADNISDMK